MSLSLYNIMNIWLLLLLSRVNSITSSVESVSMSCKEDGDYRNNWDATYSAFENGYFLNGQYSYHNNGAEDRRFKWRWCKPAGSNGYVSTVDLGQTSYDATWTQSCNGINGGNAALIGVINSQHSNGAEDRVWKFRCGLLDDSKYELTGCQYTDYLNGWDAVLDYDCPNNGVIRGIGAYHDNGKEDRRYKFECCQIVKAYTSKMSCTEDGGYRNNWDGDFSAFNNGYFLNGQYSQHNNGAEDRQFKWRWCKPEGSSGYTSTQDLAQTAYDATWTQSCTAYNGGNAALIGVVTSHHDNGKEDRIWKFRCGILDSRYQLTACQYTGYLNNFDQVIDYDCVSNGVIRSINSYHDNGAEDRRYKFECCNLIAAVTDEPTNNPTPKPTPKPTDKPTPKPTTSAPTEKMCCANGGGQTKKRQQKKADKKCSKQKTEQDCIGLAIGNTNPCIFTVCTTNVYEDEYGEYWIVDEEEDSFINVFVRYGNDVSYEIENNRIWLYGLGIIVVSFIAFIIWKNRYKCCSEYKQLDDDVESIKPLLSNNSV